jgi:hypothetical protein
VSCENLSRATFALARQEPEGILQASPLLSKYLKCSGVQTSHVLGCEIATALVCPVTHAIRSLHLGNYLRLIKNVPIVFNVNADVERRTANEYELATNAS